MIECHYNLIQTDGGEGYKRPKAFKVGLKSALKFFNLDHFKHMGDGIHHQLFQSKD